MPQLLEDILGKADEQRRKIKEELMILKEHPQAVEIINGECLKNKDLPCLSVLMQTTITRYLAHFRPSAEDKYLNIDDLLQMSEIDISKNIMICLGLTFKKPDSFLDMARSLSLQSAALLPNTTEAQYQERELRYLYTALFKSRYDFPAMVAMKFTFQIANNAVMSKDLKRLKAIVSLTEEFRDEKVPDISTPSRIFILLNQWLPLLEQQLGRQTSKTGFKTFLIEMKLVDQRTTAKVWSEAFDLYGWGDNDRKGKRSYREEIAIANRFEILPGLFR